MQKTQVRKLIRMKRQWLNIVRNKLTVLAALTCIGILLSGCKKEKGAVDYNGFPREVGEIIVNKCAACGCHNTLSKDACAGLGLSSWSKLFEGGRNNSSVTPFRPDQSFLLFSNNAFPDLGAELEPALPMGKEHLSKQDVETIRDRVAERAPDANGYTKWPENPNRNKNLCDEPGLRNGYIDIIDQKTLKLMEWKCDV